MLLAVDIGNSHITLGVFSGEELVFTARMVTDSKRTEDLYAVDIHSILALNNAVALKINSAIISSVVPELTEAMSGAIKKAINIDAMILGPGIKTGVNIKIDNPAQLGADLVAGGRLSQSVRNPARFYPRAKNNPFFVTSLYRRTSATQTRK